MRTLWKGAVSFGLVNIPVNMYAATEHKDIKFNYLHKECLGPVEYHKYCPRCQKEISSSDIVRGYEYHKGTYVVIPDEDLERIPAVNTKTIDILDFVELSEVDPIYYDKSYYLQASPGGEKAYALLVNAMKTTGKIAIAKVVIRSKSALAVIRCKGQLLVMETIFYPDEIRSDAVLASGINENLLHENEIKMAVNLIENLSTSFDPDKYQDEYRQALWELITARVNDQELVTPDRPAQPSNIVDLMEALRESVKLSEQSRGQGKKESAAARPRKRSSKKTAPARTS
ncbi:MAG: Ku protein [Syntrophomonadaceae bacterium]|jgi:DNA end-binding protein Ku